MCLLYPRKELTERKRLKIQETEGILDVGKLNLELEEAFFLWEHWEGAEEERALESVCVEGEIWDEDMDHLKILLL